MPDTDNRLSAVFTRLFDGDNQIFQAGFGLMGLGVGLRLLQQGLLLANTALRRRMLVTLEINNKDPSYVGFLTWLAHQQARASPVSAASIFGRQTSAWVRSHQLSVETAVERRENGSSSVNFMLVAGPGSHIFKYNGAWMQVKRERETRSTLRESGMPWETVTLMTLSRDRALFQSLLKEAWNIAMRGKEGKLVIHTAWGIEWRPFGNPREKRPLNSVVLAPGVGERIEQDVKAFLARKQWYANRGIPYRRGYLLHGPPGSGKTSFIQALAGSLGYDICLLNLSERGLGDDKLNHLLSNVPARSFVLIEDVDAAFNKRVQSSDDGYQSSVTFSGFLNALDGVASGEERIVFMTTNHIERLDPALIRPGRVDLSEVIDNASPQQAKRLFTQFYQDSEDTSSEQELSELADSLEIWVEEENMHNRTLSMATLQGLFIQNSAKGVLAACKDSQIRERTPQ